MPAPTVPPHALLYAPVSAPVSGSIGESIWVAERIVGGDQYVAVHPRAAALAIEERVAQRVDKNAHAAGQTRKDARRHLAIRSDNRRRGLHAGEAADGIEVAGVSLKAHDPARRDLPVVADLKAGEERSRVDLVTEYRRSERIREGRRAGRRTDAATDVKARPGPGRLRVSEAAKSAAASGIVCIKIDTNKMTVTRNRPLFWAVMFPPNRLGRGQVRSHLADKSERRMRERKRRSILLDAA